MKPLWNHQKEAIARALVLRDFALFMEPGCGKTRTMIEILKHFSQTYGRIPRTLIFAPIVVVPQWKEEFAKFSPFAHAVQCLVGPGKRRQKTFTTCGARIFVTNYEAVQMVGLYGLISAWKPEVLICDESQKVKNHKALRTKRIIPLAELTDHNFLLTGTPILNSQMDLFSQYRILDRGDTFGKNFFTFRLQYFYDKNSLMPRDRYFPNWMPKPSANALLSEKLAQTSIIVKKQECLDLPPLVKKEIPVELGPEQRRIYDDMKQDFVAYVNSKAVVAQLAITKALRMAQIVSGFTRFEDGTEEVVPENPRIDALKELLELYADDHKIIVWAVFKRNYAAIAQVCKKLGLEYAMLTGETKDKEANIEAFRKDPECRVMIANPGAGGIGINLVESSMAIYFSRSFSYGDDVQSEARNHRGGSEMHTKVTRFDLIARGTIDEAMYNAIKEKQNLANEITDWKKMLAYL